MRVAYFESCFARLSPIWCNDSVIPTRKSQSFSFRHSAKRTLKYDFFTSPPEGSYHRASAVIRNEAQAFCAIFITLWCLINVFPAYEFSDIFPTPRFLFGPPTYQFGKISVSATVKHSKIYYR